METFSVREIATIVHAALQEAGGEVESARPKAVALVNRCCAEFVRLVASEASAICLSKKRKVVGPEHIALAIDGLGFGGLEANLEETQNETRRKSQAALKKKRKKKRKLTPEEEIDLAAAQEAMFDASRKKMYG